MNLNNSFSLLLWHKAGLSGPRLQVIQLIVVSSSILFFKNLNAKLTNLVRYNILLVSCIRSLGVFYHRVKREVGEYLASPYTIPTLPPQR